MSDPIIKVTRLGRGWGVRCLHPSGALFKEAQAKTKAMIGPVARELLRLYDKTGGTQYTDRARFRCQEKGSWTDVVKDQKGLAVDKKC